MTNEIWDEKPEAFSVHPMTRHRNYDADKMDPWLEKLKTEWDRKHLKAHAWVRSKEEYFENKKKLKAIESLMRGKYYITVLETGQYSVRPAPPSEGDRLAEVIMEILFPDEEDKTIDCAEERTEEVS